MEKSIIVEQTQKEIKRLKLEILEKQKLTDDLLEIINNSKKSEFYNIEEEI